jgi:acyl-CoA synthetase (AMP-forming)/AMP-acid ligase II
VNILEVFRRTAETAPSRVAIFGGRTFWGKNRTLTFHELDMRARQLAALFRQHELKKGDVVLVFVPMSAELYAVLTAAYQLGLIVMFVDPAIGSQQLEPCVRLAKPQAFIGTIQAYAFRLTSPALRGIEKVFVAGPPLPGSISLAAARKLGPYDSIVECDSETPALITFTSGSTGMPKGVVRTHGFLLNTQKICAAHLALEPGSVDLTTMPIFAMLNLASGISSVIPDIGRSKMARMRPDIVVAQIKTYHPASTVASPEFLTSLAGFCLKRKICLNSFRRVIAGGAPVFPRLQSMLASTFPNAEIVFLYGSTEAEPIACISPQEITAEDMASMLSGKGLLAGRPVPEINLRIIQDRWGSPLGPYAPEQFDKEAIPPGQAGEIVVSGDHVCRGYVGGQGDCETKIRVEGKIWHRTGDAGWIDGRGRLWLLGSCAARIADERGILYPLSVEGPLSNQKQVARSACISQEGRRVLVLELREPLNRVGCAALLDSIPWALMEDVIVVRRIPLDARQRGKVNYPGLRRLLESHKGRYIR